MRTFPKTGTIIAPTKLHLALYQELLKESTSYLSLRVLSLSAFLDQWIPHQKQSDTTSLYQYRQALQGISETNDFYPSCSDASFLKECLQFLKLAQAYSFCDWPASTNKEKDLKEILSALESLSLYEKDSVHIDFSTLEDVYILPTLYSGWEGLWIDRLIQAGAHWLHEDVEQKSEYVACSTSRKQAQWIAQTIIKNNWQAEDIWIACADANDPLVLEQILASYDIPYTLLSKTSKNPLLQAWIDALRWEMEPKIETFLNLVESLDPRSSYFADYLSLFPEAFPDFSIVHSDYQENPWIDENQWHTIVQNEEKIHQWLQAHDLHWKTMDLSAINQLIQSFYVPSQENKKTLQTIQTTLSDALPFIKSPADYPLLIAQLESLQKSLLPSSIQGVLIGSMNDFCALRPVVFLTGAIAGNFPQYQQETGIFNEAYLAKTSLPNLETRLQIQKDQLNDCMRQVEHLLVTTVQNDYQGKTYEPSIELDSFFQRQASFQSVRDSSHWVQPEFFLSPEQTKELYCKEGKLYGSVSRLETFVRCPLRYFLQYGLKLREKKEWTDIRSFGSLLHQILETITKEHGKDYPLLEEEVLKAYINQPFTWLESVFPSRRTWIQHQKDTLYIQLRAIFHTLACFEEQWHMEPAAFEKKVTYELPFENCTLSLVGYIDRIDTSKTSFMIFDYKSGSRDLKWDDFTKGLSLQLATYTICYEEDSKKIPVGNYYITLRKSPIKQDANKCSYNTKIVKWSEFEEEDLLDQYDRGDKLNGWCYQDPSTYADKDCLANAKKPLSFVEVKEAWESILASITTDILSGNIQADHAKDACTYCAYRAICRNARNEVEKPSRLMEENE